MKKSSIGLRRAYGLRLLSGTALALLSLPAAARAQTKDATPNTQAIDAPDTIVVTASRATQPGFVAPTPTTVIGAAAIEQRGATNIAQILNEQPQFRATSSPAANGIRTQQPGSSTADLRGIGAQRTLVLVNGGRIPPLAPGNNTSAPVAPDMNTIPTLMVERIEVVTGGASAQWGSDAVAGVVNIRLRNQFEGLEITGQNGISKYGDAGQHRLGVLAGKRFGNGGHIVLGADYVKNDQMGDLYSRPWGYNEYGRVANAAYLTNGQAPSIISTGVHAPTAPGGLITGPASFSLINQQFLAGGVLAPFDLGGIRNTTQQIGGSGQAISKGVSLAPGVERFNPYLRVEYVFSPALTLYADASYAVSIGKSIVLPARDGSLTIFKTNPFLPAAVVTAMGNLTSFTMSRIDYDLGNAQVRVRNKTPHFSVGGEGNLGGTWKWDAHVGYGENNYLNNAYDDRNVQAYKYAVNAVTYNGQIVCAATVPGAGFVAAAAGCVPINLFGSGSPSPAALAYVKGTAQINSIYRQLNAAANLHGEPFSTWAGPVSVAVGVEYRRESETVTVDPVAQAGGWEADNATAFSGKFHVLEGYVEGIVPLARNLPFAHRLDLNGAVRVANYSSSGTQTTWKVGLTWDIVDGLRLRGTRSHDIRAPAIFELNSDGAVTNLTATVNGISATIPQNFTIGNPSLNPESAETLTAGVVLQPRAIPGLSLSVDYYNINLTNAITTIGGAQAGTLCSQGSTYFCSLFTFNGTTPASYKNTYINGASYKPEGIDLAFNYRHSLGGSHKATLSLRAAGTYSLHLSQNLGAGTATVDYAGDNSSAGSPRFRTNSSLTYDDNRFSLTAQFITVSGGLIDATAVTPSTVLNINHVAPYQYVNLQGRIKVGKDFEFFMGVNNLFNTDPPAIPNSGVFSLTNGEFYDTVGRFFTAGFKAKF